MTALNAQRADSVTRYSEEHAIPFVFRRPLAANEQPYQMWQCFLDTSGGTYALAKAAGDSSTASRANFISAGAATRDVATTGSTDATAELTFWDQVLIGYAQSTIASDSFVDADFGKVWWSVDNQTIGKLSNSGGFNRSMGGIFLGLDFEQKKPIVGIGPAWWLLARATHAADNEAVTWRTAADGAANTTTSETGTARRPLHMLVTSVNVAFDTAVTGSDTVYATITVYARDKNGANQRTIATGATGATSATTNWMGGTSTAFKPQSMTLTATAASLQLLETDVITYAIAKAGAGTQLPAATISVNGRIL